MTYEEKRRLAVQREIQELQSTVRQFDQVVADARRLADELRAGVARLESIQANADQVDARIAEADKLLRRGPGLAVAVDSLPDALVDIARCANAQRLACELVDETRCESDHVRENDDPSVYAP